MADYRIDLYNQVGVLVTEIDSFFSIDCARVVNGVGILSIIIPDIFDRFIFYNDGVTDDVIVDNRIQLMRRIGSGTFGVYTDTQWFIRKAQKILSGTGERKTVVTAVCANNLLTRRIAAYNSGSSQSEKTAAADDLIKAIVRENLGSLASDPLRSLASYLTVQANTSLAPSVAKAFARRNVMDVLQEVALSSYQTGTYLAFDVIAVSPAVLDFRTYITQRGIDHRWPSSPSPLLFGPEYSNLTNIDRGYDHSEEVTYGYAGGMGVGAARIIGTAQDATRIAQSPFGRIEKFSDARLTVSAAIVADEADMLVKSGIPRNTFTASIIETPATIYGLQYGFGDYVTAVFEGESIDARIDKVRIQVRDGKETIDAQIQGNIA